MQKRKGISLIVLVITIVVMIILAGAIIISLNNAGIIGKANAAVDSTNEATVKQLADLKWSEAYLNGARTQADLEKDVLNSLSKSGIDMNTYEIKVTENGVTAEKIESEYSYYGNLELAIGDVNANTIGTNADSTVKDAEAVVYTHNNNVYVALLKDVALENKMYIYKDMELKLNGHEIVASMPMDGAFIHIGSNGTNKVATKLKINASMDGSKITATNAEEIRIKLVAIDEGSVVNVNGGIYTAVSTGGTELTNVFISKGELNITNSTIRVNETTGKVRGIDIGNTGKGIITKCKILVTSSSDESVGIRSSGSEIVISQCEINSTARGIHISANKAKLNNCEINSTAGSIVNFGTTEVNNCIVNGMVDNQGEVYINGGTYLGLVWFSGSTGLTSYVNGATINKIEVGYNNHAYMNNCKITSRSIKLRRNK